jgi:hypothetical protein
MVSDPMLFSPDFVLMLFLLCRVRNNFAALPGCEEPPEVHSSRMGVKTEEELENCCLP